MTRPESVTTPDLRGSYSRQKVVTPSVGGYGAEPCEPVTAVTAVTKQSAFEAKGNHVTTVTTHINKSHGRTYGFEGNAGGGDAVTSPIPAALTRARRLIAAQRLPDAAQALADVQPIADYHDARTLQAARNLLGIGAAAHALAVLDGHQWAHSEPAP